MLQLTKIKKVCQRFKKNDKQILPSRYLRPDVSTLKCFIIKSLTIDELRQQTMITD